MTGSRRTVAAKGFVLMLYRIYRKQGRTPLGAMEMVRSATLGIARDDHIQGPTQSEAAMQAFFAGRYLKIINERSKRSPHWKHG